MKQETEFLKVSEAAILLRISAPSVYRKIADGTLPAYKLGDANDSLRLRRSEIESFLYRHRTQVTTT